VTADPNIICIRWICAYLCAGRKSSRSVP